MVPIPAATRQPPQSGLLSTSATGDCIVDLYFYDQDGAWTVTYVEARSHTAETAPTTRCLKSLLERPTASAG